MAKVGDSAHTDHGLGTITDIQQERGGRSFRVAGRGFNVWVPETKLHVASGDYYAGLEATIEQGDTNEDNSTTLPYDPSPQYPVDLFSKEQTIQPGDYEIDPDERLHSSDSLSGDRRDSNRPYPGPSPDLFAKSSAYRYADDDALSEAGGEGDDQAIAKNIYNYEQHLSAHRYADDRDPTQIGHINGPGGQPYAHDMSAEGMAGCPLCNKSGAGAGLMAAGSVHYAEEEPFQGDPYKEWGDDEWHSDLPDGPERTFDAGAHDGPSGMFNDVDYLNHVQNPPVLDRAHEGTPHMRTHPNYGDPGYPDAYKGGPKHRAEANRTFDAGQHSKPSYLRPVLEGGEGHHRAENYDEEPGADFRPAGLDDRYAFLIEADDERDPITAWRRDPVEFMQRHAYMVTAGEEDYLHRKFADYDNLLEIEAAQAGGFERTAAWTDVRQKAQRLRHDGKVHVKHVTPQHIYATVNGDHGTYDTMIVKGASGAFTGGQAISNWSCDCDWGKWAFQRKVSYVGRLCSHAYAAYLDMQSHYHKDNKGKFKAASIVDDFKSWAKENNDGHMDAGSMSDFINTCKERVGREDADKLYDYLAKNVQQAPERDYDIPYTFNNEEAYKTAEALRQRPLSLTPDLRQVPPGEENQWTDVTEDDRKTTGPGEPGEEQILHFGALAARLHREADLPPGVDPGSVSEADLTAHPDWRSSVEPGGQPSVSHEPANPGQSAWDQKNPGQTDTTMIPNGAPNAPRGPANPVGDLFNSYKNYAEQKPGGGEPTPANLSSDVSHPAPVQVTGPVTKATPQQKQQLVDAFHPPGSVPPAPGGTVPGNEPGKWWGEQLHSSNPGTPTAQESTTTNTDANSPWSRNQNTTTLDKTSPYTTQRGDTLTDISNRMGLGQSGVADLAKANGITDPNKLNVGQELKMPGVAPGGQNAAQDAVKNINPTRDPGAGLVDQAVQGKPPAGAGSPGGPTGAGFGKGVQQGEGALPKLPTPPAPAPPPAPTPPANPASPAGAAGGNATGLTQGIQQGDQSAQSLMKKPASFTARLHRAENDDDDNDDDDTRPDTGEAAAMLTRLRNLGEEDQSDHYQDMDSHNDEIRDLVEKLNDAGVDAMPFVAHRLSAPMSQRWDSDPSNGDGSFAGQSNPNWADEPATGSGPDPRYWMSDSASYVDQHERPDFIDLNEEPDGDIIKFNDSRSKPQQGPRHGNRRQADDGATLGDYSQMTGMDPMSYTDGESALGGDNAVMASRHYADDEGVVGDGTGYFNSENPTGEDWEQGSGTPFMNEVGHAADQASGGMPGSGADLLGGGGGAGGEEGGAAGVAEEAPELLALARRAGRGPTQQVRVDRGARGWQKAAGTYSPPEDFGYDGESDLTAYGEPAADPGMGADVVASFQRSAGALQMMHGQDQARPGSLDDFASSPMVQGMLRTAGRKFSPEEQRMLEAENHPLGARNLPTDDELFGTHYLLGS